MRWRRQLNALKAAGDVDGLAAMLAGSEEQLQGRLLAVLDALVELGLGRALPPVVALLDDPRPKVRRHAIAALGAIGDPAVTGRIAEMLADDDGWFVDYHAVEALEKLGGEAAIRALIDHGIPDVGTRPGAIAALGRLQARSALPAIQDCIRHDASRQVRTEAAIAIVAIRDVAAFPALADYWPTADAASRKLVEMRLAVQGLTLPDEVIERAPAPRAGP